MSENNNVSQKTLDLPWYEARSEKKDFLPKHEGINYYLVLKTPEAKETIMQDGGSFKSINMEARILKITDLSGNTISESPKEPYDGILSISFAVNGEIVAYMKQNNMPLKSIVGNVVRIGRVGTTKNDTRYLSVGVLSIEEFEEKFFKLKK